MRKLLPGLVDGRLKVLVERVSHWRDIWDTHALIESHAIKGKNVCSMV